MSVHRTLGRHERISGSASGPNDEVPIRKTRGRRKAQPALLGPSKRKAAAAVVASGLVLGAGLPGHAYYHADAHDGQGVGKGSEAGAAVAVPSNSSVDFSRGKLSSTVPVADGATELQSTGVEQVSPKESGESGSKSGSDADSPTTAAPAPPVVSAPLAQMLLRSGFGYRTNPLSGVPGELHTGVDLAAQCSTAVYAAGNGTVTQAGWSPYGGGNRIVVDHGNGLQTTYNHLATIGVQAGQSVTQGQQIAGAGTTGNSTGCHLHFEVIVNGQAVDPYAWL